MISRCKVIHERGTSDFFLPQPIMHIATESTIALSLVSSTKKALLIRKLVVVVVYLTSACVNCAFFDTCGPTHAKKSPIYTRTS
jgi:hypothetical protein